MEDKKKKVIIFDLDDTLFDSTNQPIDTGGNWLIKLFDGMGSILESNDFINILVTRGFQYRQNRKIDVLGIRKYFEEIHVVDSDVHKHEKFVRINKDFQDREIIVIGNRIDCEIRYANQLGLKTIHIKHGKYSMLEPKDHFEIPSHQLPVDEIVDLVKLI